MADTQTISTEKYSSGQFKPVIEQCDGCERIIAADAVNYCKTYINPQAKWKLGICNFATHKKPETLVVKVKVNPLKASKRAMAGR